MILTKGNQKKSKIQNWEQFNQYQGTAKEKKSTEGARKGIVSQNHSFWNFYAPEEVDGDPGKRAKLKRYDHGFIASIPKDGNDLVDKHFSDSYHIKSIYFDDEDEYKESFDFNQDKHYSKTIKKLNNTE